jgi:outer membrane receptor protein involved in Fe transport
MDNGSTLTPRIDVFGQSTICSSAITATSCADGYTLVNLRGEWHSPGRNWSVAIGGTNVTDEEYYLNIFDLQAFGQPSTAGQPGRPFEWYLQVRRHF